MPPSGGHRAKPRSKNVVCLLQLKPVKRGGNRRYYQHHEVLLVRRIRGLLYEQGFTISGAKNRLAQDGSPAAEQGMSASEVRVELCALLAWLNDQDITTPTS